MNLYEEHAAVGDEIELIAAGEFYRLNSTTRFSLAAGAKFTITRVYGNSVQARSVERISRRWDTGSEQMSFMFSRDRVRLVDPNRPVPRRLGTPPEGEGIIGIDHPGIQWLFDDMGEYANREGYCSQYDALCVRLGIPGRPRDFTVTRELNGIRLSTTVKARSQREANELVDRALNIQPTEGPSPEDPDPEPTPSDPRFAIAA